ncbi:AMP-binding protein [Thermodesulfobacteriota bacterium]
MDGLIKGQREATIRMEQIFQARGDTWPKILKYNYEKYGENHRAMRHKHHGIWQPYTWKDYYENVKYIALGLLSLGLEPEDKVLIIGDNAPEWYYAELAVQSIHGVSVGLYSELMSVEIESIAKNSEAKFAIVEDQEQVDKLLELKDKLPLLKKIIYWNYKGLAHYNDPILAGCRQVAELGKKYGEQNQGIFENNVESGRADDVCAVVYTSGTTETSPKGAVHTFRTLMTGAFYYLQLDPWYENDNTVPYLPPAWMTEQIFGIGCHLLSACILNFAESPETQQRDVKETGPGIVIYEARIWENQAANLQARILAADSVKRFFFRILMPIGYEIADLKYRKETSGLFRKILYFLAHFAMFGPIKKSLGLSNARICYSTGSALSPDAFKFYHALNLPLRSLYGSTEGGAITGARHDNIRIDTVGPVHKGIEMKITDNGELIYRHPGIFIGYYDDQKKTAEVLKDGWFHSGDSGFLDKEGHIVFLDRLEDIVDLANGEKLAPQSIESRLRSSPYIMDAWIMTGPNKDYTSAVIIINYESVGRWAGQRRLVFTNFAELSQSPEVYDLIMMDINRINQDLSPAIKIKKFINLHRLFDPDENELTRTRKLRRSFLKERYREIITSIYEDKTEVQLEIGIEHRDGRKETEKAIVKIKSV